MMHTIAGQEVVVFAVVERIIECMLVGPSPQERPGTDSVLEDAAVL
jgi:hypothetical protein